MRSPLPRPLRPTEHRRGLLAQVPLQRGIIILPSAFTLGNLFFGVFAIVAATRGEFEWAAWYIVFAGILDMLDGRVARATLYAPAYTIMGGTSSILRNIIATRALGLPAA